MTKALFCISRIVLLELEWDIYIHSKDCLSFEQEHPHVRAPRGRWFKESLVGADI